jgi:hypothetical protein
VLIDSSVTEERPELDFEVHEEWCGKWIVDVGRKIHFDQVEPEKTIRHHAYCEMQTINRKAPYQDARSNRQRLK